ncbi:MAG TPA: sigma-70 family RNA polymerase sigma factor [Candidatus Dormibacteraeota bacterium]
MTEESRLVEFPVQSSAADLALEELEFVYAFIYARVGNRADAEDLTQQVALKAIPRLRAEAGAASIRAYLFATARSALNQFWARKLGMPEEELPVEVPSSAGGPAGGDGSSHSSVERVTRVLAELPPNYRRVLELRFLRGYSLKEVAAETGSTVGAVKVMQLRALRAAAKVGFDV